MPDKEFKQSVDSADASVKKLNQDLSITESRAKKIADSMKSWGSSAVNRVSGGFNNLTNLGQSGSGNLISGSLGSFNTAAAGAIPGSSMRPASNAIGGATFSTPVTGSAGVQSTAGGRAVATAGRAVNGLGSISSALTSMGPDIDTVMGYRTGYYNAGIMSSSNSQQMRNATFGAITRMGGMTSAGADERVASMLAGRGMNFSSAANSTYMQTVSMGAGISKYLNMPVEASTQAVADLTSGSTSAGMMNQFGIMTSDMATGKEKTMAQIFEELAGRLTLRDTTADRTRQSIRKGALGASINSMSFFSGEQKALFSQYMIDRADGKSMDWANNLGTLGDANPMSSTYDLNASETQQFNTAGGAIQKALEDTTDILKTLNDTMGEVAKNTAAFSVPFQLISNSSMGKGATDIFSTIAKIFTGGTSVATSMSSASSGSGYSSNVGGNEGGSTGSVSSSSGPMFDVSSLNSHGVNEAYGTSRGNGKSHGGIDYNFRYEPVYAVADGKVYNVVTGKGNARGSGSLGNQIEILHIDSDNNQYTSIYGHLSEVYVSARDDIKKGQVIGKSGNSGDSSGPHLHFELRKGKASTGGIGEWAPIEGLSGATSGDTSSLDMSGATSNSAGSAGSPSSSALYVGASSLANTGFSGLSASALSAAGAVGAASGNVGSVPSAFNGSTFGGQSSGSGTGYKSNAPSAKTGDSYVANDGPVNVHAGEAILTTEQADAWRSEKSGGRKGSGTNVTINVTVARASEEEARKLAQTVKKYIQEDKHLAKMGSM